MAGTFRSPVNSGCSRQFEATRDGTPATARDRWIGWSSEQQFRRLHLIANNSRFVILTPEWVPNLASRVLGLSLRRPCADIQAVHGYPALLAETFVDPARFAGTWAPMKMPVWLLRRPCRSQPTRSKVSQAQVSSIRTCGSVNRSRSGTCRTNRDRRTSRHPRGSVLPRGWRTGSDPSSRRSAGSPCRSGR